MGKKMMSKTHPQSHKISKNHDNKLKKQQLNTLINLLKPKVYITDSSNFKKVVQLLTGNNKETTHPDSYSSPPAIPQPFEAPVMPTIIHDVEDFSVDSSQGSGQTSSFGSTIESSMAQYKDLESWLMETDLDHFHDAYVPMAQQDFSVFDSYDIPCPSFDDNYQIQY